MAKDIQFYNLDESLDDFTIINEGATQNPELSPHVEHELDTEGSSLSTDLHNSIFKFLDEILMEETKDEKNSIIHDPLALQATEKSFYEVVHNKYPPSPSIHINTECAESLRERTCETNGNTDEPGYYEFSVDQFHLPNRSIQSSVTISQPLVHSVSNSMSNSEQQSDYLNSNQFMDSESKLQFWKGVEEAKKFLPDKSELIVDLENYPLAPSDRGRKNPHHQDSDLDVQRRKQSSVYEDEVELSEMFDNLLLRDFKGVTVSSSGDVKFLNGVDKYMKQYQLSRVPRSIKLSNKKGLESDAVYLQSLLLSCAQATTCDNLIFAHEQLKLIKQYASSTGDACQRVANVFANGLEARLAHTGAPMYVALVSKKMPACQILKAFHVYLSACPFLRNSTVYAHNMILKIAAKGSSLHIVDFGICYGFQWAVLIQFLSIREGGPPKLRITGIDFPQAGFRPAEVIEEAGHRLAKHCKRLNVPFEYQAVARQNWDKIDINDLKLARDEVLVVNCSLKFQNLPQVADNPMDGVLKLIRNMKPDLFVHSIVNGSYNSPFFMTRFREAFYYYASLFEVHDATLPRNDMQRLLFENELYGHEVVNIIACEGKQRVVRPKTYKQWDIRSKRAGFKIVPLEKGSIILQKVEKLYRKDFLFEQDCNWMLQGWKGRVLYGISCWVPV